FYPDCIWKINTTEKILYLTFDDGPHPEITPYVLGELNKHDALATFFCIGNNVKKYPEEYQHIINEGHRIANHTFDHLSGWKTADNIYLENISKAAALIDSKLFRPPYGRITKFQLEALKGDKFNLTTVMWTVLSGDFDEKLSEENCYLNVINNSKPGSIVVFHDSLKAFARLKYVLPRILKYFSSSGYRFKTIEL
ncbi:MAG: polysaccharide deacetylase family protein, partial [Bacteroidota bacterium]|nr:polysaccharide deacetylase family protein [Bacteroidota bacterium]